VVQEPSILVSFCSGYFWHKISNSFLLAISLGHLASVDPEIDEVLPPMFSPNVHSELSLKQLFICLCFS
jgi:hypothetical protein